MSMALSVNKRPLLRWDLVCSNDGGEYKGVLLTSTNTDKRSEGDTLYINKTGSIIGPHLLELFNVRCLPHPDGMTIKGKVMSGYSNSYVLIDRRYYATLVPTKRKKKTKV
jgi:hypothetical protein